MMAIIINNMLCDGIILNKIQKHLKALAKGGGYDLMDFVQAVRYLIKQRDKSCYKNRLHRKMYDK